MNFLRASIAAVGTAAVLSLTACGTDSNNATDGADLNKVAGDVGDVVKGQSTDYVTSQQTADFNGLENTNPGIKALRSQGYGAVAIITKKDGTRELVVKVCDGAPNDDCLSAKPTLEQPTVYLPLKGDTGITPTDRYALGYASVGGRHLTIRCDAKTSNEPGIPSGVVSDFATIGSQVNEKFAKGVATADQVLKVAGAEFTCDKSL